MESGISHDSWDTWDWSPKPRTPIFTIGYSYKQVHTIEFVPYDVLITTMKFEAGDHVFVARGPAGAIKHHAIVVTSEDKDGWMEIVEFGVFDKEGNKKLIAGTGIDNALAGKYFGEVRKNRVKNKSSDGTWKPAKEEKTTKTGTNTTRSPEEVVRAALFLLENGKNLLPKYHITLANGECFAQWCQTGHFSSGQADNLYGSIQKVQTVAKMLPVAAVATGGKKGSNSTKSKAGKTAATAAIGGAVTAAAAMVDKRSNQVHQEWVKTNKALDEAYQAHLTKQ